AEGRHGFLCVSAFVREIQRPIRYSPRKASQGKLRSRG
ncbi:hypothetical protein SAMN05216486_1364, partial [bacterium JGI 053]